MNFICIGTFILIAVVRSSLGTDCIITTFSQVDHVVKTCKNIIVSNLVVPAKKTLQLHLKSGTTLKFEGRITFDYAEWGGPLIKVVGEKILITGAPDSVIDGQGALYWDGLGSKGKKKPKIFQIQARNSVIENINILNCPVHCVSIHSSSGLTARGWNIDVSDGDENRLGHNTDGFDINSSNLIIENCSVRNQDDCIAINQGSNIFISNMYCSGGHGLSLSVGKSRTDFTANSVSNITFINSIVHQSVNGIHLKTHTDSGPGLITNVTYENMYLSEISNYGINIQQDYFNGGSSGITNNNIPITNFILRNVTGTLTSFRESPTFAVKILCGDNGCYDWFWSGVSLQGAQNPSSCNYEPSGYTC